MILLNSNKINTNEEICELIYRYELEINFSGIECGCGSRNFHLHGTYQRNIVDEENEFKINIKRVKCKECGVTHALIPDFLLPYYQTPSDSIFKHISEMVEENKSTVELEKETNISRQKLNQWRNFYYRLINAIRETFSKIVKIKIFFNSQKRVKVYHNYKTRFLIQITT